MANIIASLTLVGLTIQICSNHNFIAEASNDANSCKRNLPLTSAMLRFQNKCYQFVNIERYWPDAKHYCNRHGGRLVMIDDPQTNTFIVNVLNSLSWSNNGVWIGLHDNERHLHFRWSGGPGIQEERLHWSNWGKGHPAGFLHKKRNCVRLVRGSGDWKWHETFCRFFKWHYKFICEYDVTDTTTLEMPTAEGHGAGRHGDGDRSLDTSNQEKDAENSEDFVSDNNLKGEGDTNDEDHNRDQGEGYTDDEDFKEDQSLLPEPQAALQQTSDHNNENVGIYVGIVVVVVMLTLLAALMYRRRCRGHRYAVPVSHLSHDSKVDGKDAKSSNISRMASGIFNIRIFSRNLRHLTENRTNRAVENIYVASGATHASTKKPADEEDDSNEYLTYVPIAEDNMSLKSGDSDLRSSRRMLSNSNTYCEIASDTASVHDNIYEVIDADKD